MFKNFNLTLLRRHPRIAHYFRYPLHHDDFHELHEHGRLVGRIAAKPLYGKLTPEGKVDRSAGFNGQIAVIFIPARARSAKSAQLLLTRIPSYQVTNAEGKRNWRAIRSAAAKAVRASFRRTSTEHH